jgi:hypothetical protein
MMQKNRKRSSQLDLNQQGANALLAATFDFLHSNAIPKANIVEFTRKYNARAQTRKNSRQYSELQSAYEEMGIMMATWFSDPKFLDAAGNPIPLSKGRGSNSLTHLIRASRAKIQPVLALELMSRSPSIKFESEGKLAALRRVFVLPELEVPRAAFVVERYLDTLQRNAASRKRKHVPLLLERSCHVSEVDLSVVGPLLRDIEGRGTAFMDSIDGEIEVRRLRREGRKATGEMGVLVFAWTRPNTSKAKGKK